MNRLLWLLFYTPILQEPPALDDITLPDCRFRSTRQNESRCQIVTDVACPDDDTLAIVNKETCLACSEFYPPAHDDWNPIIGSLLVTAARKTGNKPLALAAFEELYHLQTGGFLDKAGRLLREEGSLPRCAMHRSMSDGSATEATKDTTAKPSTCLHLVRREKQLVGTNAHRSGWPFAINALADLQCRDGILFDDFVEQRFCYQVGSPGYQEDWVGIFHHPPPQDPHFLGSRFALAPLFETRIWRETEPYLRGGIALSEHLASYLRERLQIPIEVVKHPGSTENVAQWSPARFLANGSKQLVQLGWFGRNTQAIYQMKQRPDYTYVRVLPNGAHYEKYEAKLKNYNDARGVSSPAQTEVVDRTRFTHLELHAAHTSQVFVTEMLAASANNAVLDCVASRSPLLINRHPAVVEYLGPDYPLYFDDLQTAHKLLDDDRIIATHNYLTQMDRHWLTAKGFRDAISGAMTKIRA